MAGRLRRSNVTKPGLTRQRCGRGWLYLDADRRPVRDPEVVERVKGLVIPPAWRDVWICPWPNGHIQAVGTDDAGRRQYLYHEEWRRKRDQEKHERVLRLAKHLPEFRAKVEADLTTSGLGCARVLAGALRMLDRGVFRTGNDQYEDSRGVATLLRGDVQVRGGELYFDYIAKGGIERRLRIRDDKLAVLVTALRRGRQDEDRLLVFRNGDTFCEVHADDINARLQELIGSDFTAKDLRTWHATVLASVIIAGHEHPRSERARKRTEATVMREVSEQLGNTPAVARRSYVDPRVLTAFEQGRTIEPALKRIADKGIGIEEARPAIERAVVRMLKEL